MEHLQAAYLRSLGLRQVGAYAYGGYNTRYGADFGDIR